MVFRPERSLHISPGRCPGLICLAPSARNFVCINSFRAYIVTISRSYAGCVKNVQTPDRLAEAISYTTVPPKGTGKMDMAWVSQVFLILLPESKQSNPDVLVNIMILAWYFHQWCQVCIKIISHRKGSFRSSLRDYGLSCRRYLYCT
jgi:hypothetical protein